MRKKMRNRWMFGAMASILLASVLVGCGDNTDIDTPMDSQDKVSDSGTEKESNSSEEPEIEETPSPLLAIRGSKSLTEEEITLANTTTDDSYLADPFEGLVSDYSAYPYFEDVTLDIWMPTDSNLIEAYKDLNDSVVFKQLEELTGIKVNIITPALGEAQTAFNLMLSRKELPDIILDPATYYSGGVQAGVDDGAFLDLTDLIQDHMPNYMAVLGTYDQRWKDNVTDEGKFIAVYGSPHELLPVNQGPCIKVEAMEKTKWTEVPETVEEWHDFLKACKDAGYEVPLMQSSQERDGVLAYGFLASAYGAYEALFLNDEGKVAYGPIEPGMKDYLTTMRSWYEEGLIDPEVLTSDSSYRSALLRSERCAVTLLSPATTYSAWYKDNGWEFVAGKFPTLEKGDQPKASYSTSYRGRGAAITTQCKNVAAALAFLDFGFTKKGWEIMNWGSVGDVHLIAEDGMPYYHEDGAMYVDLNGTSSLWQYRFHTYPCIRDDLHSNPVSTTGSSQANDIMLQWFDEIESVALPGTTLTTEESARIAEISDVLSSLRNEYLSKIILGQLPVDAWDEYVNLAKQNGIDEYIAIYQAAYERYQQR